jgi:hypothetical protein
MPAANASPVAISVVCASALAAKSFAKGKSHKWVFVILLQELNVRIRAP